MFEIDAARTSLPLSPDRVLALVASLNTPNIVAANLPVEPTRAYVCAYREGLDKVGFSIYLHCVDSEKGTFYRHEDRLLQKSQYDEAMVEALAFAESLGFMMDDLGFCDLSPARQRELIEQVPLFHEPKPPAPTSWAAAGGAAADGSAGAPAAADRPTSPAAPPPAPSPAAPARDVAAAPAPASATPVAPVPVAPPPVPVAPPAASVAPPAASVAPPPVPVAPPPRPSPAHVVAARAASGGPAVLAATTTAPGVPEALTGAFAPAAGDPRARGAAAGTGRAPAGNSAVKALIRLLASL